MGRFLECCCNSVQDVLEAQKGGASRIELCERLDLGGVTPSESLLASVLGIATIPVNVLIRPATASGRPHGTVMTAAEFVYSEEEICQMEASIAFCRNFSVPSTGARVNGVVIGALTPDGAVDASAMRRLVAAAGQLNVTFHRAFDVCADPLSAFNLLSELGCDTLLTSGHADNALSGAPLIAELVSCSAGSPVVMAGCGVRPSNIAEIESITSAVAFHSSSRGPSGHTEAAVVASMVG